MKNIYWFLYYCFAMIIPEKRREIVNPHEKVSSLLSMSIGMFFWGVYLVCKYQFNSKLQKEEGYVLVALFVVYAIFINHNYFVKKRKFRDVMERYDGVVSTGLGRLIAFTMFIGGMALFMYGGYLISMYVNV